MDRERLEHLIVVLKRVYDRGQDFSLSYWAMPNNDCGTTSCALGWAALDRTFRQQGLKLLNNPRHSKEEEVKTPRAVAKLAGRYSSLMPVYADCAGYAAASAFFGLNYADTRYLFDPSEYPDHHLHNPLAVVARIEETLGR